MPAVHHAPCSHSAAPRRSAAPIDLRTPVPYCGRGDSRGALRWLAPISSLRSSQREQVSELIAVTANLFEERKRIRRLLAEPPPSFGEVRKMLNELARIFQ